MSKADVQAQREYEALLTEEQAAERLGVSPGTLRVWRCKGRYGLPYVRLGAKSIRYRPEDVEQFIEDQTVVPTMPSV